jgi:hypothetical protein
VRRRWSAVRRPQAHKSEPSGVHAMLQGCQEAGEQRHAGASAGEQGSRPWGGRAPAAEEGSSCADRRAAGMRRARPRTAAAAHVRCAGPRRHAARSQRARRAPQSQQQAPEGGAAAPAAAACSVRSVGCGWSMAPGAPLERERSRVRRSVHFSATSWEGPKGNERHGRRCRWHQPRVASAAAARCKCAADTIHSSAVQACCGRCRCWHGSHCSRDPILATARFIGGQTVGFAQQWPRAARTMSM